MNSVLAFEKEHQPEFEIISSENGSKTGRITIGENDIKKLQGILAHFSSCKFMDTEWSVSIASSGQKATLRFPQGAAGNEDVMLRVAVLDSLCAFASVASCKRIIHDAATFLAFLEEQKIPIENCRSSVINVYVSKLDSTPELSVNQKNNLIRAVAVLLDVCSKYDLLQGTGVIDCSYRWKGQKEPKRAPDSCVTEALDLLFFDITNVSVKQPAP